MSEEKKTNDPEPEENLDELDDAANDLEPENKLNITNEEDDINDEDIEKELGDIMKNIKNPGKLQEGLDGMGDMMSNMLKDLGIPMDGSGLPGEAEFEKMFGNMDEEQEGNEENPHFDKFANMLLEQIMEKELLYEPLTETRKEYEKFFKEKGENVKPEQMEKYKHQYECIMEILKEMDKPKPNKEEMIKNFEKMPGYGEPPEGVMGPMANSEMGLDQLFTGMGSKPGPNAGKNPDCNIF